MLSLTLSEPRDDVSGTPEWDEYYAMVADYRMKLAFRNTIQQSERAEEAHFLRLYEAGNRREAKYLNEATKIATRRQQKMTAAQKDVEEAARKIVDSEYRDKYVRGKDEIKKKMEYNQLIG